MELHCLVMKTPFFAVVRGWSFREAYPNLSNMCRIKYKVESKCFFDDSTDLVAFGIVEKQDLEAILGLPLKVAERLRGHQVDASRAIKHYCYMFKKILCECIEICRRFFEKLDKITFLYLMASTTPADNCVSETKVFTWQWL